jgi:basic membrane protein A and related proteins
MKISRLAVLAVLATVALAVAACGKSADEGSSTSTSGGKSAASDKKVALIIAQGGLGDKSYNDLANSGFKSAVEKTGVQGRPIESNDVVAQAQPILERATQSGFGLVIDLEFSHADTLKKVAAAHPNTQYALINAPVPGKNVTSVLFQEQEGSYLAGVLAAAMTTDTENPRINAKPIIGVIGGTKSTGIDKFLVGYIQGAKATNPKVNVLTAYSNDFGDPTKGKQIADSMYDRGADIIYQVAGGTGAGVIEAAKARKRYAIGVDTDQDGLAPGSVLTSMVKRTDLAVARLVEEDAAGQLHGGQTVNLGLKDDGVGLSEMKFTKSDIPADILTKVDNAKQGIIDAKIKVWNVITQGYPSFYKP